MTSEIADHLAGRGHKFPTDVETQRLGFYDWFTQKLLGLDSEQYRREFWREVKTTGHTIGHMPRTLREFLREDTINATDELSKTLWVCIFMGGVYPFWFLGTLLDKYIRKCRRSSYYAQETARRHALADKRRAITVRRTPNEKPTLESIRESYAHVGDSPEAALRLGALLEDLECYVDNHAYTKRGVPGIRGRAGGIKRLFENEAPDLFRHYKSVMRYKALAKKYRQACDCVDPVPVGDLLPFRRDEKTVEEDTEQLPNKEGGRQSPNQHVGEKVRVVDGIVFPLHNCLCDVVSLTSWMKTGGNTEFLRTQKWVRHPDRNYTERNLLRDESLSLAAEMLRFCDGTLVSLEAAIALKIDPSCVTENFQPDARVRILVPGQNTIRTPSRVKAWLARRKKSETAA